MPPFDHHVSDWLVLVNLPGFGGGSTVYKNSFVIEAVMVREDSCIGPLGALHGSGGYQFTISAQWARGCISILSAPLDGLRVGARRALRSILYLVEIASISLLIRLLQRGQQSVMEPSVEPIASLMPFFRRGHVLGEILQKAWSSLMQRNFVAYIFKRALAHDQIAVRNQAGKIPLGDARHVLSAERGVAQFICSRCIYDNRVSSITFDTDGVCNYCYQADKLSAEFQTGLPMGLEKFRKTVLEIKAAGKGKEYDCVIGVSGGTDSSYLVHLAIQEGLRPLAVHYDNTWNSAVATTNMHRILSALGVDLHTHVLDNKESDDIFRSFFLAGVAEIEAATDLGYAYLLRKVSREHGIRFILEGHSFLEEGVTPLGRNYFDGRYIRAVHKIFGEVPLRTYPLMTFSRFMYSIFFSGVKFVRPLWYLNYEKEAAKRLLTNLYGWQDYGGHHLENRMTAFYHGVYLPSKFGTDMRNNVLSARVRNGTLGRDDAIAEYSRPPVVEKRLISLVRKRLRLSEAEYLRIMNSAPKEWRDFPTYKAWFELLRPIFKILAERELVPMSFYLKYCLKENRQP